MISISGKIPIKINLFFFLIAGIIGFIFEQSLFGPFLWIIVIFISILVHEMGHALMAILFKRQPSIIITPFGGLTYYKDEHLSAFKQFLITLNGPIFGLLLFVGATFILSLDVITNVYILKILIVFKLINLFWTIINLLPILPLDGGNLIKIIFESIWGIKGFKAAIFFSMIVAFILSAFCFLINQFLIGAIFFLFAFQNFSLWRSYKNITIQDRNENNVKLLQLAEDLFKKGDFNKAKDKFTFIRQITTSGVIFIRATYYLALIKAQEGNNSAAYKLLFPVKHDLPEDALCFLQQIAFEEKDYSLVAEIAANCYKINPSSVVAMINAKAFAYLKDSQSSGGWLKTAFQIDKKLNAAEVLNDEIFISIKDNKEFKKFFK